MAWDRVGGVFTSSSLLNVFNSIVDSLLCRVKVALLSRLGRGGVGQRLRDGLVVACYASVAAQL